MNIESNYAKLFRICVRSVLSCLNISIYEPFRQRLRPIRAAHIWMTLLSRLDK